MEPETVCGVLCQVALRNFLVTKSSLPSQSFQSEPSSDDRFLIGLAHATRPHEPCKYTMQSAEMLKLKRRTVILGIMRTDYQGGDGDEEIIHSCLLRKEKKARI